MRKIVFVLLLLTLPLTASALNAGAISSFNIARDAESKKESDDIKLMKKIVRYIDHGDKFYVSSWAEDKGFVSRFENALARSGLSPSTTEQVTPPVKIEYDGVVSYELWGFVRYVGKTGQPALTAQRIIILCDRAVIGGAGGVNYKIKNDERKLDFVSTYFMSFSPDGYQGTGKKEYLAICSG